MRYNRRGSPHIAISTGREKTAIRFELCFSDAFEETTAERAAQSYQSVIEQLRKQGVALEVLEHSNKQGRSILSWLYTIDTVDTSEIAPAIEKLTEQMRELHSEG